MTELTIAKGALIVAVALMFVLAATAPTRADERVEHYEAKASKTLSEAVANFADGNAKLSVLLQKPDLAARDLEAVHELTYTLEKALAKMRGDLAALADRLEALHLASEAHETAATRAHGVAYLETARTLTP